MHDVLIVGAGPAGLTAARVLREAGIADIAVLERTASPGGLPRYAGHLGWGMLDFHRLWRGPAYARKLAEAAGVPIRTGVSVVELRPGGGLVVSDAAGLREIRARAVLLATGIREAPRSARLLSGSRPWGVMSTGAFQELVMAGGALPFRRPVVLGSELVSFSALMTAKHAGIRPVAMIEENARITARRPGDLVARALFGVPVLTGARLLRIEGEGRVEAVVIERAGREERLACDGLIVSGRFVPEAALVRPSHLAFDPATGGPAIDDFGRCSDPAFFAAGNLLRAVEHSGAVALEARRIAGHVVRALAGGLPAPRARVVPGGALAWVTPQRASLSGEVLRLEARAARAHRGVLRVIADGRPVLEKPLSALPERRLTLEVPARRLRGAETIEVRLD